MNKFFRINRTSKLIKLSQEVSGSEESLQEESAKAFSLSDGMIISFGHDNDKDIIDIIKEVSKKLVSLSYLSSEKLSFDKELSEAIISFQKDNNLNVNGQIDDELYQKIINGVDIVVKKTEDEKKLDSAITGENYAVKKISDEEKEERRKIFKDIKEEVDEILGGDEVETKTSPIESSEFNAAEVASSSGIPEAMILAFIKGESGGDSSAKAFNGDNFCNALGWSSSSKVEEFLNAIEREGIKGNAYHHKSWHQVVRFAEKFNGTKEEYEKKYKPKGYSLKGGYIYFDTAYFNAHKDPDSVKAFDLAYKIDPTSAVISTAWGMGQVMGNHLIKTNPEILKLSSGKEAREYFDSFADKASSNMYVSWVKSAGKFPSNKSEYINVAKEYGIEEVLGASFASVIDMASKNPDNIGYFLFLTKRYYGGWDKAYAKRLQDNYKKYSSINNRVAKDKRIKRFSFFKNISRSKNGLYK